MHKLIQIFIFVFCSITSFGQKVQKEGIVNLYSSMDPEGFRRYIWFADSTVIFEIYEQYSDSRNDSIISEGCRLAYYTILDLQTMHAQDYFLFSENSEPFTDYYLKENEYISWNFYSKNQAVYKCVDSLIPSSDTIIDDKKIKIYEMSNSEPTGKIKLTYGLNCSNPKTIFHFFKALDDLYPNCQFTYFEYKELSTGFSLYNKLSNIRDSLTNSEKMIFKKWESNLKNTSLPSTSQTMAKQFIFTLRSILRYHR